MSRGRERYSRNHGLKLTDRILSPVQEWQVLLTLLFNAGLMLCDLSLFPPLLSQGGHLLKFSASFPLDNYYYNRFFRKVNTFFQKNWKNILDEIRLNLLRLFIFLGRWWELNPLSPKANVSKGATLSYLSLLIRGSPFYLTAICTLIVSYFKEFVKREFQISLKIC